MYEFVYLRVVWFIHPTSFARRRQVAYYKNMEHKSKAKQKWKVIKENYTRR